MFNKLLEQIYIAMLKYKYKPYAVVKGRNNMRFFAHDMSRNQFKVNLGYGTGLTNEFLARMAKLSIARSRLEHNRKTHW
jgi:hypothetical protein